MCVIAVKPSDVDLPREEILKAMWDKNSDGAGFMYAFKGDVFIEKGFMVYDDFRKALSNLEEKVKSDGKTIKDTPIVLHYRITTHGGTSPENTHPFPVSDKEEHLKALDVKCKLGMAHNGVISSVEKETTVSDTMVFIRDIVSPLSSLSKDFSGELLPTIKAVIGWSRLAFLHGDGKIDLIGDFKNSKDNDGLSYSNLNHEVKYNPPAKTYNYYDDDYYDDLYNKYGYNIKSRKTKRITPNKKAFEKGAKYVLSEEAKNRTHLKADKERIFIYTGGENVHYVHLESQMGRFSVVGETRDIPYWRYFSEMVPYVKKEIDPNKNNIGGRNNEETKLLTQNANRIYYKPERNISIGLYQVPKGQIITNFKNLERKHTKNAVKNGNYTMIVQSDNVFYWADRWSYLYRQKDGNFMQINPADACYEYINENGKTIDFKSSLYFYNSSDKPLPRKIFKGVIVYTRNSWVE